MHASLASIGRAFTVEDEDPPETSRNNSMEAHSEKDVKISMPGGLQQLVDCTVSLSASFSMIPGLRGAVAMYQNENSKQYLKNENQSDTNWEIDKKRVSISPHVRLTVFHRLCESTQRTVQLEFLTEICNELGCGLRSLATYSAGVTLAEYEVFKRLSSAHFPHRPIRFPLLSRPQTDRPSDELKGNQMNDFTGQNTSYFYGDSSSTLFNPRYRSQLGELRVICESLRQCLTQVKQLEHEQNNLRLVADGCSPTDYGVLTPCSDGLFQRHTSQLVTDIVVAAHHLVNCGLKSITKTDLTTFTHGELWEITRGIEELDILSKSVQTVANVLYLCSLRQFLCRRKFEDTVRCSGGETSSPTPDSSSRLGNLVCDPLMTVPCISIGYMFDLIARERSVRLVNSIYSQLSAMIFIVPATGSKTLQSYFTGSVVTPTSLVDAFRTYLHENYDRSASEYLRSEYEFISGFLDILSQSTNLLYEVQRLNSVYSAAEALVTTQSGRSDGIPSPVHFSFVPEKGGKLQHATSVEGKHGILMKGTSSKASHSLHSPVACSSGQEKGENASGLAADRKSKNFSRLQELLHRSDTLDRYVATGSCLSPFTSANLLPVIGNFSDCSEEQEDGAAIRTKPTRTHDHAAAKKVVQWSDQRDIRTRHQMIGRYLEMTWSHTEYSLHNQLLWPPSELIVRSQSVANSQTCTDICGSVTSCLLLPAHQLLTISKRIREVTKSGET